MKKIQENAFSKDLTKVNEALIGKEPDWRDVEALIEILGDTEQGWGDIKEALGDTLDELHYHGNMDRAMNTLTGRYSMTDEEATRVATTVQAYLQDEDVDLTVDWDQSAEKVTLSCENDSVTIPAFEFLDMVRGSEFFMPQDDWSQIKQGYAVTVPDAMYKEDWQALLKKFNTFNESVDYSNFSDDTSDFDLKFEDLGEQQAMVAEEAVELALGKGGEVDIDDQKDAYAAFMRGFMRIWPDMGGIDFQESN